MHSVEMVSQYFQAIVTFYIALAKGSTASLKKNESFN